MKQNFIRLGRILFTVVAVAAAGVVIWKIWDMNANDPWTRDAHLRADIVSVAPDVSGIVTEVAVRDNQAVTKGEVLFRIDPQRFQIALDQATAAAQSSAATLAQAKRDLARYTQLTTASVTLEQRETAATAVETATAADTEAQAGLALAKLNLDRSEVRAPVDGRVTNLQLQPGDYVTTGTAIMALVATRTMRVEAYFEETKLPRIETGDLVHVRLMGHSETLTGRVEGVAGGIVDRELTTGTLIANVTPTFTWVRLAQRVPVRIALEDVPPGIRLISGLSATVEGLPGTAKP